MLGVDDGVYVVERDGVSMDAAFCKGLAVDVF
jgi:hypothetical protein